ncbi:hypothetical protein [Shewanella glacialipiscicola]|uniref:hypothetical protein n=1 Tax=Shewanella glacialipiscicola TaxID=614069 RepID=UPI003D78B75C
MMNENAQIRQLVITANDETICTGKLEAPFKALTLEQLDNAFNSLTLTAQRDMADSFNLNLFLNSDSAMTLGAAAFLLSTLTDKNDKDYFDAAKSLLDISVTKLFEFEDYDWLFFVEPFARAANQSNENNVTHYFLVKTNFLIAGEHLETVVHAVKCSFVPDLLQVQAEIAQSINKGKFDNDIYIEPCFFNDGFVTWPKSIEPLSKQDYEVLAARIDEFSPTQDSSELDYPVRDYLR